MESTKGHAFPVQRFVRQTPDSPGDLGLSEAAAERVSRAFKYLGEIAARGLAPITEHDPRDDVFLDLSIEGVRFQAFAETDPYVARKDAGGWCQLGVATIDRSCGLNGSNERCMVCKYGPMEGRIDLSMLSDAGRRAFAIAFGVPIGRHSHASAGAFMFYASPALDGLIAWAKTAAQVRGRAWRVELPRRLEGRRHTRPGGRCGARMRAKIPVFGSPRATALR